MLELNSKTVGASWSQIGVLGQNFYAGNIGLTGTGVVTLILNQGGIQNRVAATTKISSGNKFAKNGGSGRILTTLPPVNKRLAELLKPFLPPKATGKIKLYYNLDRLETIKFDH